MKSDLDRLEKQLKIVDKNTKISFEDFSKRYRENLLAQ